jgi:hypothetical protein
MTIKDAIERLGKKLLATGYHITTDAWQGVKKPTSFYECLDSTVKMYIPDTKEEAEELSKCNMPWAEAHFQERISGFPVNPGETYKQWPFYGRDKEMRPGELFSHTYMERYWPKYAGETIDKMDRGDKPNIGIRYEYGDLEDVITHLSNDPFSRQAYIPVFFPEDTGAVHGGRIPCSIGYHFIIRFNRLHVVYQLRSCDYLRHLPDDIYLTVRLAHHLIEKLNNSLSFKQKELNILPGMLTLHITSLHIFSPEVERVEKMLR